MAHYKFVACLGMWNEVQIHMYDIEALMQLKFLLKAL